MSADLPALRGVDGARAAICVETPRLMLREMTLDDAPALAAVLGDRETMRWYPHACSDEEVQEWIARQASRYPTGAGLLGMILKETGGLIGDCGVVWQEVEGRLEPEIGYHVHRGCWNRGFASEAARAVRDYAFATLDCDHVISMIRPENMASRRVAEKNGLRLEGVVWWREHDHCLYRLRRPGV